MFCLCLFLSPVERAERKQLVQNDRRARRQAQERSHQVVPKARAGRIWRSVRRESRGLISFLSYYFIFI